MSVCKVVPVTEPIGRMCLNVVTGADGAHHIVGGAVAPPPDGYFRVELTEPTDGITEISGALSCTDAEDFAALLNSLPVDQAKLLTTRLLEAGREAQRAHHNARRFQYHGRSFDNNMG